MADTEGGGQAKKNAGLRSEEQYRGLITVLNLRRELWVSTCVGG